MTLRKIMSQLLTIVIFLTVLLPIETIASTDKLDRLITRGGYLFVHEESGRRIKEEHLSKEGFTPASTTKIITAMIALDTLGEDYRFKTEFYYHNQSLFIVGHGDPMLISEEVKKICYHLKSLGLRKVKNIVMAGSDYGLPLGSEATNKRYEAKNGRLSVNFNSVTIKVRNGIVRSGNKETPELPIMTKFGKLRNGTYRYNINNVKSDIPAELNYAAQLFTAMLKNYGIKVKSKPEVYSVRKHGRLPRPLLIWDSSYSLKEVVAKCLEHSNNFIANQLFLKLSGRIDRAAWLEAQSATARYLRKKLHLMDDEIRIVDGAGLSRANRISPQAMIKVLDKWKQYYYLLPKRKKSNIYYKTGTLNGVYCLAGYHFQKKKPMPFVIFLNQAKNNRSRVLDELLKTCEYSI